MMQSWHGTAATLAAIALAAVAPAVSAQDASTTNPVRLVTGAALSYFPGYVLEDAQTRQWGVSVLAQLVTAPGRRFELAYTHVPQPSTTASAAPRLHALRVMYSASTPVSADARVRLAGSAGASVLKVDAQTIDCGDFPLCSEWAPRDGTRIAPVAGAGLEVSPADRLEVFAEFRVFRPLGEPWSPSGEPAWLTEAGLGMRVRL